MIRITVRINQLDLSRVEGESAWPGAGPAAGIRGPWPSDTRAFELLILGADDNGRPLTDVFRQEQFRRMIPHVVEALREPQREQLVARLDGAMVEGELLGAFKYLVDPVDGTGRFVCSEVKKLGHPRGTAAGEPPASVRLQPSKRQLAALCADPTIGLERSIRLRVVSVPDELLTDVLELDSPDDERWGEVAMEAGYILSTTRGLRSLQILTHRHDAATVKNRILQRLQSLAPGGQTVPA